MSIWHSGGLFLAVLVLLYALPLLVAWRRKHQNAGAIGVLNLLLGWTLVGWVVSLVWALTAVRRPPKGNAEQQGALVDSAMKDCPFCAERILAAAKLCKHCGSKLDAPAA